MVLKTVCVIPARLESSRFPRKILANLGGKPLLQWAYEAAVSTPRFHKVVIAVDAEETKRVAEGFGAKVLMTSVHCQTGTDRLIELVKRKELEADLIVGWQADEPFIKPLLIEELLQTAGKDDCSIWTLCKKTEEAESPHVVKVVRTHAKEALYFSRSPIPYYRDAKTKTYYKHVGIYAFTPDALKKIAELPPSPLEEAEKLEQLRFLQGGLKIKVHDTTQEVFGIDTPEQLEKAKKMLEV